MLQDDITIDVSGSPYESGFKFNTIPFGGMTIDTKNSVRIGSAAHIKFVPPSGFGVIVGTTGTLPTPGATYSGALFLVQNAVGTADQLYVCLKDAANPTPGYSWKSLATG